MSDKLAIVFDGPPSHESGRFVEVELNGASISFGEWQENGDYWELVLPDRWAALAKAQSYSDALEAKLSKMEAALERIRANGGLSQNGATCADIAKEALAGGEEA